MPYKNSEKRINDENECKKDAAVKSARENTMPPRAFVVFGTMSRDVSLRTVIL